MDPFPVSADRLADEVLDRTPVVRGVAGIDDGCVQAQEVRLVGGVERGCRLQRRGEPLSAPSARGLTLQRERRARLLGEEVFHGSGEDRWVVALHEVAGLLVQPRLHRLPQPRGESHGGTELRPPKEIVGDPVTPGIAAGGDRMPVVIEGTDVVARLRVFQVQGSAGEGLVEEPRPPAEGARRLRPYPGFDGPRVDLAEGSDQDTEVESLMAQREAEVRHDRVLRRVPQRVDFRSPAAIRLGPPGARDDVAPNGWPRNRQIEVAEEPGLADRSTGFVAHGSAVARRLRRWRNHYNTHISWKINSNMPRLDISGRRRSPARAGSPARTSPAAARRPAPR